MNDDQVSVTQSYKDVVAGNVAAHRARLDMPQETLAARMRALGWKTWRKQTVSEVEAARRAVQAEEVFGLAIALEINIPLLMAPSDPDGFVKFPNGAAIHGSSVERLAGRGYGFNDHAVQWQDDGTPMIGRYLERPTRDAFDRDLFGPAMAAQGWPEHREQQQSEEDG